VWPVEIGSEADLAAPAVTCGFRPFHVPDFVHTTPKLCTWNSLELLIPNSIGHSNEQSKESWEFVPGRVFRRAINRRRTKAASAAEPSSIRGRLWCLNPLPKQQKSGFLAQSAEQGAAASGSESQLQSFIGPFRARGVHVGTEPLLSGVAWALRGPKRHRQSNRPAEGITSVLPSIASVACF
jgi:hypothetical protein